MTEHSDREIGNSPPDGGRVESQNSTAPKRVSKTLFLHDLPVLTQIRREFWAPTESAHETAEGEKRRTPLSSDEQSDKTARTLLDMRIPETSGKHKIEETQDPQPRAAKSRFEFAAKTKVDQDMLADTIAKFELRKEQRAIEEAKQRASQPSPTVRTIEYKRRVMTCTWQWPDVSKEKVRHCQQCQLPVYNFDGLDQQAAEALIFTRENIESPILYKRADGKFMTQDCPVQASRTKTIVFTSVLVSALGLVTVAMISLSLPPALVSKTPFKPDVETSSTVRDTKPSKHPRRYMPRENKLEQGTTPMKSRRARPTFGPDNTEAYWE